MTDFTSISLTLSYIYFCPYMISGDTFSVFYSCSRHMFQIHFSDSCLRVPSTEELLHIIMLVGVVNVVWYEFGFNQLYTVMKLS